MYKDNEIFEKFNIEEFLNQCDNAIENLDEMIEEYNDIISEISDIDINNNLRDVAVDTLTDQYNQMVQFMQELKFDIIESLESLEEILSNNEDLFEHTDLSDKEIEDSIYKTSIMVDYISSLLMEYNSVMESEEFAHNYLNNYDDEDNDNDDDNKIINFYDFVDDNDIDLDNVDETDLDNNDYLESTQNIEEQICQIEDEINSVISTLKERGIDENFINKITKRNRRLVNMLKSELDEIENDDEDY